MLKRMVILLLCLGLCSCQSVRVISPYDDILDRGVVSFSEQLNAFVKNMGDLGGTPEGAYEANRKTYNALEAKLDTLIWRAASASQGHGCKLEQKLYVHIRGILQNDLPPELQPDAAAEKGNTDGCNEWLLVLVKRQLELIKEIHRSTDKCGKQNLSCLRPATVKTALQIVNQSINAVSVVETAKKK